MVRYRLSNLADRKIAAIYEYSLLQFGETQADVYFFGLHDLFDLLVGNPLMGREEPELGKGVRRFIYEAHIVFYRLDQDGVLILDVRAAKQQPKRHTPRDR